jgi:diacylglycerol kinase
MIRKLLRSFINGFAGLGHALGAEQNLRIHCAIACCVVAAGCFFALAPLEWIAVLFCIGLVIAAECMNTALERLADRVSLEKHPLIKQAKDSSAAAVLVLSIMATAIGGIVFVPRIQAWFGWTH